MAFNKQIVHEVIFEADTPAGRAFDVALIVAILASVTTVFLDSLPGFSTEYGRVLSYLEWFFTVVFTIEYALRLWCIRNTWLYARSFYGIVDLIGIAPSYLSLLIPDAEIAVVVRLLRVLRVFRVLRLVRYVSEGQILLDALLASRRKVTVFLVSVFVMVVIFGAAMYLIEGTKAGITSIPEGIYWAVVTLTTVGYGDIAPVTPVGRTLASFLMIMGYGIFAVPTGIVTLELSEAARRRANTRSCPSCSAEGHSREATYCWRCGSHLFRPEDRGEPAPPEVISPSEPD